MQTSCTSAGSTPGQMIVRDEWTSSGELTDTQEAKKRETTCGPKHCRVNIGRHNG